jgi:hypothetical protein
MAATPWTGSLSESGEYTLRLVCDRKACEKSGLGYPLHAVFIEPTRMHAMAKARSVGWMLQHGGKVLCPDHAIEKRAVRREIPK